VIGLIKKIAAYGSAIAFGLVIILLFFAFQFTKPSLPETELNALDLTKFRESAQILVTTSLQKPANISLTPRQVSYLAQNNKPDFNRYGLELKEVHLESQGQLAHLRTLLEGPFGSWLILDGTAVIELNEQKQWSATVDTLWAGQIPVHWILPATLSPDWPTVFKDGQVKLHKAKLDGQGLRTRLSHKGLDIEIPGIEIGSGLIDKSVETLKEKF